MGITTYPEMNEQIKDILKLSENPASLYAAQRIEELETENARCREALEYYAGRKHFTEFGVEQGGIARKALEA